MVRLCFAVLPADLSAPISRDNGDVAFGSAITCLEASVGRRSVWHRAPCLCSGLSWFQRRSKTHVWRRSERKTGLKDVVKPTSGGAPTHLQPSGKQASNPRLAALGHICTRSVWHRAPCLCSGWPAAVKHQTSNICGWPAAGLRQSNMLEKLHKTQSPRRFQHTLYCTRTHASRIAETMAKYI